LHLSVLSIISVAFLVFTIWVIKKNSGSKIDRNTVRVISAQELRRANTHDLINTDTA